MRYHEGALLFLAYVGQTGRSLTTRHREHIRYIKTNNPLSAYAMHILNNRHEYGKPEHTLQLLQPCQIARNKRAP